MDVNINFHWAFICKQRDCWRSCSQLHPFQGFIWLGEILEVISILDDLIIYSPLTYNTPGYDCFLRKQTSTGNSCKSRCKKPDGNISKWLIVWKLGSWLQGNLVKFVENARLVKYTGLHTKDIAYASVYASIELQHIWTLTLYIWLVVLSCWLLLICPV